MATEEYKGVGRQKRRMMVKMWKESGTSLSLKQWARTTGVGHVADVWVRAKAGKNDG